MRIEILYLLIFTTVRSIGQEYLIELHSTWDYGADQWEIIGIDGDEEVIIELSMRWPLRSSIDEWVIRGGEVDGTIKTKWWGDRTQWELRWREQIVSIRLVQLGFSEQWEIRHGLKKLYLSNYEPNNPNQWITSNNPNWRMRSEYINDFRDWFIDDYLDDEFDTSVKIALIFIALINSITL